MILFTQVIIQKGIIDVKIHLFFSDSMIANIDSLPILHTYSISPCLSSVIYLSTHLSSTSYSTYLFVHSYIYLFSFHLLIQFFSYSYFSASIHLCISSVNYYLHMYQSVNAHNFSSIYYYSMFHLSTIYLHISIHHLSMIYLFCFLISIYSFAIYYLSITLYQFIIYFISISNHYHQFLSISPML